MVDLNKFVPTNYVKYIAAAVVLAILIPSAYFGVKGFFIQHSLNLQNEEVKRLNGELAGLKQQKAVKEQEVAAALALFNVHKDRADKAEAKLSKLKPVVLPPIKSDTEPSTIAIASVTPECMEQIKIVQDQYIAREEVFQEVITEQKTTIDAATVVIAKLESEVKTDNEIIATHEIKDQVQEKRIDAAEKKALNEESKKKVYRTATGILGAVVLILLL